MEIFFVLLFSDFFVFLTTKGAGKFSSLISKNLSFYNFGFESLSELFFIYFLWFLSSDFDVNGDFLVTLTLSNIIVFDFLPIGAPQPLNATFFFVLIFNFVFLFAEFQTFYLGEILFLFRFSTNNTYEIIILKYLLIW